MKNKYLTTLVTAIWLLFTTMAYSQRLALFIGGGAASTGAYTPQTATFDASAYLRRAGALANVSDGKAYTISFWFKPTGADSTSMRIFGIYNASAAARLIIYRNSSNKILVIGRNASNTTISGYTGSTNVLIAGGWVHVMACANLAVPGERYLYINGVAETLASVTHTDDTLEMTANRPQVCGDGSTTPGDRFAGHLCNVWFDDVLNNVPADYITGGTTPVNLGTNGENPTGTSPPVFFSSAGSGDSWTNSGTGGAFTLSGSLTSTTPPPN